MGVANRRLDPVEKIIACRRLELVVVGVGRWVVWCGYREDHRASSCIEALALGVHSLIILELFVIILWNSVSVMCGCDSAHVGATSVVFIRIRGCITAHFGAAAAIFL